MAFDYAYAGLGTLTLGLLALSLIQWRRRRNAERAEFIMTQPLPRGLYERLQKRHPGLSLKECQLVNRGLRQFFLAYLKSGCRYVSMPSQVADDLWHEFILYTRHYEQFCRQAFGRFLHHTPAVVLSSRSHSNAGLRRCWWYACKEELIDPARPTRLPLLFALDAKLRIPNGFRYAPDCRARQGEESGAPLHCGTDFADAGVDGDTSGFGPGDTSSDLGTAAGDADGGGGCGGGGCGGGGD